MSLKLTAGLLCGFACAPSLWCGIITFHDEQEWISASGDLTTIDFALWANPKPDSDYAYLSGLSDHGVTFTGNYVRISPYLYVRSPLAGAGYGPFLYGAANGPACFTQCGQGGPGTGINVELPADITSVGWDFANFYQSGAYGYSYPIGLEVDFNDGTVFASDYTGSVFPGFGGSQFVGFTSSLPISSFLIMGGGVPTVQNFSFGSAAHADAPDPSSDVPDDSSDAPEPTSLSCLAIGMMAAGCIFFQTARQSSRG